MQKVSHSYKEDREKKIRTGCQRRIVIPVEPWPRGNPPIVVVQYPLKSLNVVLAKALKFFVIFFRLPLLELGNLKRGESEHVHAHLALLACKTSENHKGYGTK